MRGIGNIVYEMHKDSQDEGGLLIQSEEEG
jgi:hypothetical protein